MCRDSWSSLYIFPGVYGIWSLGWVGGGVGMFQWKDGVDKV